MVIARTIRAASIPLPNAATLVSDINLGMRRAGSIGTHAEPRLLSAVAGARVPRSKLRYRRSAPASSWRPNRHRRSSVPTDGSDANPACASVVHDTYPHELSNTATQNAWQNLYRALD